MPGVRRYLQNHIRERLFEVRPFPSHEVGGISQQWFDDIAAMERCEISPEYAAVKRDINTLLRRFSAPNRLALVGVARSAGYGSRAG